MFLERCERIQVSYEIRARSLVLDELFAEREGKLLCTGQLKILSLHASGLPSLLPSCSVNPVHAVSVSLSAAVLLRASPHWSTFNIRSLYPGAVAIVPCISRCIAHYPLLDWLVYAPQRGCLTSGEQWLRVAAGRQQCGLHVLKRWPGCEGATLLLLMEADTRRMQAKEPGCCRTSRCEGSRGRSRLEQGRDCTIQQWHGTSDIMRIYKESVSTAYGRRSSIMLAG